VNAIIAYGSVGVMMNRCLGIPKKTAKNTCPPITNEFFLAFRPRIKSI
jgi:hypothetical protein